MFIIYLLFTYPTPSRNGYGHVHHIPPFHNVPPVIMINTCHKDNNYSTITVMTNLAKELKSN